jgi:2-(1,2-epoxy-1,2-dihydrophenyl)acetyl-CoA isomerase
MTESIAYQVEGSVATLTLNRPEVLNALTEEMLLQLGRRVLDAAGDRRVRAVLMRANGRGFCAGADLAADKDGQPPDAAATLRRLYHPVVEELRDMAKPVVVAVNGVAAGAGMSLVLAADIVLAGESASFAQSFTRVGLVPDAGSSWFLPRAVGESRARALALLGKRIGARDALSMGLVWEVVPDDQLGTAAGNLAAELAALPPQALAATKRLYQGVSARSLAEQLDREAEAQSAAARTRDFREAVAAFREKRKPVFTGE